MQLLRDAELIPVCNRHLFRVRRIWIAKTLFQIVGLDFKGHLDLLSNASSLINSELASVSNYETVRCFHFYLESLSIYFGHALHLAEYDCISITQSVSLVLVHADYSQFFLCDPCNVYCLGLFTCGIEDPMIVSEINKGIAIQPKISSKDESHSLGVAGFVESDKIVAVIVINHHYAVVVLSTTS